mmetsp:Transcript_148367/g.413318  ORF Transcript_148367/g.413318 Transcript_148367/m.413318 type:complete len:402 (+) Transcript_148367:1092-2297(+)
MHRPEDGKSTCCVADDANRRQKLPEREVPRCLPQHHRSLHPNVDADEEVAEPRREVLVVQFLSILLDFEAPELRDLPSDQFVHLGPHLIVSNKPVKVHCFTDEVVHRLLCFLHFLSSLTAHKLPHEDIAEHQSRHEGDHPPSARVAMEREEDQHQNLPHILERVQDRNVPGCKVLDVIVDSDLNSAAVHLAAGLLGIVHVLTDDALVQVCKRVATDVHLDLAIVPEVQDHHWKCIQASNKHGLRTPIRKELQLLFRFVDVEHNVYHVDGHPSLQQEVCIGQLVPRDGHHGTPSNARLPKVQLGKLHEEPKVANLLKGLIIAQLLRRVLVRGEQGFIEDLYTASVKVGAQYAIFLVVQLDLELVCCMPRIVWEQLDVESLFVFPVAEGDLPACGLILDAGLG